MVGVAGGVRNSSEFGIAKTGGANNKRERAIVSLSVEPVDSVAGCRRSVAGRRQSPVNAPRIDDRRRCSTIVGVSIKRTSGGCGGLKIGTTSPENVRCIGETQKKYFFGDERRMAFMWRKPMFHRFNRAIALPCVRPFVGGSVFRSSQLIQFTSLVLQITWKGVEKPAWPNSQNGFEKLWYDIRGVG